MVCNNINAEAVRCMRKLVKQSLMRYSSVIEHNCVIICNSHVYRAPYGRSPATLSTGVSCCWCSNNVKGRCCWQS